LHSWRTAKLIFHPLSLSEIYVVATLLEHSEADLDCLSVAREALACCAQLISVSAVYRTLDRLERRSVVIWDHAGEAADPDIRSNRRYRVTLEGQKIFERSLGLLPIDDRRRITLKAPSFRLDGRSRRRLSDDEDT
jgi:DNA-binding MarR family transcriptional regulator